MSRERLRRVAGLLLLAILFTIAPAYADAAKDVTADCSFRASEGSAKKAHNSSYSENWQPHKSGAELYIKLPDAGAGWLHLEWLFEPTAYTIRQYDENQQLIDTRDQTQTFPAISQLYALLPQARYVFVRLDKTKQVLCNVRVFSAGELPASAQDWEAPYDKCELMVVSTHQDDEFIFFGGIIPYYSLVKERRVQVVYMANCGRLRRAEALAGLWAAGERHYPEFINLKDEHLDSIKKSIADWGGKDAIIEDLVERIRRYRPEVILTHDFDGEYGHPQHKITAHAMQSAIDAAADPTLYPDSYALYGAWQVKKLYIHLYDQNEIHFDWNQSYSELGGATPLKVARQAYAKHKSQQKYYSVNNGGKYDNARFGLYSSTVGDDIQHVDLFENIVPEASAEATAEAPSETPAETTAETPAETTAETPAEAPAGTPAA